MYTTLKFQWIPRNTKMRNKKEPILLDFNLVKYQCEEPSLKVAQINYVARNQLHCTANLNFGLSGGFWVRPAQREVVKIKRFDFSYWASCTPWGHVLSLKTFCWNPAQSWAIRYSVFQPVKFTSSFEFVCGTLFSTFWHLMVKFG